MKIDSKKYPLQPRWPLNIDPIDGPYESIREAKESIQQNFIFLLQTIPGEWPMDPELGVGVSTYLFETYNSADLVSFKSNLRIQINKYLPSIKLVEANFIHSEQDQDSLNTTLKITYSIDALGVLDEIDFGLDTSYKTEVFNVFTPDTVSKFGKDF